MADKIPNKVLVTPVREIFLASGLTAAEVARRLHWHTSGGADSSRVKRALGINQDSFRGKRSQRTRLDVETAGLIAEACGHGRWEVEPDEQAAAA